MAKYASKTKKHIWWKIALPIAVVLILAGAAACWLVPSSMEVQMALEGEEDITLEFGENYTEPGAWANVTLAGRHIKTLEVEVQGAVDPHKLGDYELTYIAHRGSDTYTQHRVVHVIDSQPPQITLVSDPDAYTLPGQPYQEEGFSATDNYDGDLTAQVVRTEGDDAITYTVTDSAGNTATVTRPIVYNDPIPPELTLNGASNISITTYTTYYEQGCQAMDNCDGDISDRVQVSGSVDTRTPGTYTLTYSVSDSYGNTATTTRTVTVKDIVGHGGVIYLTFDDGPNANTSRLLDILDKYNVKVTFFVVNTGYRDTIARAAAAGHTIAIHTATHDFKKIYASEDAFFADLYKMQSVIRECTGQTATLMRFAGGSSNTISRFNPGIMTRLASEVTARGFHYFDWDVSSGDAGETTSSDQVYINVISGVSNRKSSVVLQHDIHGYSVDAVERIIQWGLKYGYTFEALTPDSPGAHHRINN